MLAILDESSHDDGEVLLRNADDSRLHNLQCEELTLSRVFNDVANDFVVDDDVVDDGVVADVVVDDGGIEDGVVADGILLVVVFMTVSLMMLMMMMVLSIFNSLDDVDEMKIML